MPIVSGGGGGGSAGFTATACAFGVADLDCHAVGDHPLKPNAVVDNLWSFTPLGGGIPAALGLTVAVNGTSSTWTATASGIWAISLNVSLPSDATLVANMGLNEIGVNHLLVPGLTGAIGQTLTEVFTIPAATTFTYSIITLAAAAANPFTVQGIQFSVVRLG